MSQIRSAADELRLAFRAVRVAQRHLEYVWTMQRLAANMEFERMVMMRSAVVLEDRLVNAAAACDASDAAWRARR